MRKEKNEEGEERLKRRIRGEAEERSKREGEEEELGGEEG